MNFFKKIFGKKDDSINVKSPLSGKVIELSNVEDEVFASGMMGQGIAIEPTKLKETVASPISGTVSNLFPTGHAVGITNDDGLSILIHVGMDTVELEGKGFEALVNQGDQVEQGDALILCDFELIKSNGYSVVTPIVILEESNYEKIEIAGEDIVLQNDDLLVVKMR